MPWAIEYYEAPDGSVPVERFLDECPSGVRADLLAVLEAVRRAPPPSFSGGGMWEAMRGDMSGFYEVRTRGGRIHYRLFCLLENGTEAELADRGFDGPRIVALNGLSKPNATLLSAAEYKKHVGKLGQDYCSRMPRPVAR